MPIDLVIDERDGPKPEIGVSGDSNNNASSGGTAGRASADTTHTDGASTPDVVSIDIYFYIYFNTQLYFI